MALNCKGCGGSLTTLPTYKGITTHCRQCWRQRVRDNRAANPEHYKAHDAARAFRPGRVAARDAYSAAMPMEKKIAYNRAYRERYPEKYRARGAVSNALRNGRLVKPEFCSMCGSKARIHGHHDDYAQPLVVRWVCTPCHEEIHHPGRNRFSAKTEVFAP